ncbi:hypothetical protein NQ315_012410 [Exocentrus adspersus]|uniref:RNase H type-1 domain-containing protein n=1 Tax=Exocentrus adspersus TaxID=1586481 RepID=A0AAV8VMK7_9CUCU|nr:hypothetical protein NQ315_012410 [Exocentrus adspersus]
MVGNEIWTTLYSRYIECTFGILANKWRIFHRPLNVDLDLAQDIIKACCVLHNFVRARDGHHSQAALHALKSPRITSQVVLECTNSLAELGQRNKVRLVWVPGHCGVTGNEEADALARKGSSDTFTGPEPAVGLPYSYPQGSIDNWTREKCQVDWSRGIGLRQARLLIKGPGAAATRSLVSLNRANIKIITGLLTGHGRLNKHLNTIGLSPDSRCRLCGTSDEDSVHVLCHCPRVIVNRHKHFGAGYLAPEDIREIPVDKVLAFARSTELATPILENETKPPPNQFTSVL